MVGAGPMPVDRHRAEEISKLTGVEVTADQVFFGRLPAEAEAKLEELHAAGAEVPQLPKSVADAKLETAIADKIEADAFQDKFLDALGIERSTVLFGMVETGHKGIWGEADVRKVIATKTPNQFLDALSEADPQYADLVTKIKSHPELAESLHSAVVKNPSVLSGLANVASNDTGEGMTLETIGSLVDDKLTRKAMAMGLDRLAANPKLDFTEEVGKFNSFSKFFAGGWDGFLEHLRNPAEMIDAIMEQMDSLPPALQDFMRGVLPGFLSITAEVLDYENGLYSDFYQVGVQGWEQGKAAGIQQRADAAAAKADETLTGGAGEDTTLGGTENDTLTSSNYDISPSEVAMAKTGFDAGGELKGTELSIDLSAEEVPRSVMAETTFVTAASATQVMQPEETQNIVADNINRNTMALTA